MLYPSAQLHGSEWMTVLKPVFIIFFIISTALNDILCANMLLRYKSKGLYCSGFVVDLRIFVQGIQQIE